MVEVPEFLVRAFEQRLSAVNAGSPEDERVELEHFLEIQMAESLSLADVAHLEREIPGIGAAVSRWLEELRD